MRGEKYECSFLPDRIEISNFYIESYVWGNF